MGISENGEQSTSSELVIQLKVRIMQLLIKSVKIKTGKKKATEVDPPPSAQSLR